MKNNQKGFVNIIIAVIVVAGIVGFVAWKNDLIPKNIISGLNNKEQENQTTNLNDEYSPITEPNGLVKPQNNTNTKPNQVQQTTTSGQVKTYAHSSGAFSFQYPGRFSIVEKPESRIALNNAAGQQVVTVYPQYAVNSGFSDTNNQPGVTIFNVNTYKVIKLEVPGQPSYGGQYVLTFETANPAYFLVFEMPQPSTVFTQKEIDALLKSVTIDQIKFKALVYKPSAFDVAKEKAFSSGDYRKCVGTGGDLSAMQSEQCIFALFTKLNSQTPITSNYCDQNPMGLTEDPRSSKLPKNDLSYVCYTALSVYKNDVSICNKVQPENMQGICKDQDVRTAIKN